MRWQSDEHKKKLKVLDLFSGIGGISLGLERTGGFKTVAFCEIEKYPRKVLAKHWPDVPIYEDVKKLTHEQLQADGLGRIDIITGGYPCQPFSAAGQRRGKEDDRHLWPEVKRLMATVRPRWGLFENVAGHVSMGLDEVLSDLEAEGYTGFPIVIPACAVDAPHRRDRVWIIAHNDCKQRGTDEGEPNAETNRRHDTSGVCANVADAGSFGQPGSRTFRNASNCTEGCEGEATQSFNGGERKIWSLEPNVGRVANGVSRRVDRLKGLGNAIVPQIAMNIGLAIKEQKDV